MNELRYEDLKEGMEVEFEKYQDKYRGKLIRTSDGDFRVDVVWISVRGYIQLDIQKLRLVRQAPKTWDNLAVGDRLRAGDEIALVLGVCDEVVFYNFAHNFTVRTTTKANLKLGGYSIVQTAPTAPAKTKLTIEQIAEKFGLTPEQVEIEGATK